MEIVVGRAGLVDADALFALVQDFATSFRPERTSFDECLGHLLADDACSLQVAIVQGEIAGYCLGFDHYAFFANGRVAWVEEIMVREDLRLSGVGRGLMAAFEAWAKARGDKLVGLATRRAGPFYQALGYEESAAFFRKLL